MLRLQAVQVGWIRTTLDNSLFDRGTGTVTWYKPEELTENLRGVATAKQSTNGRICDCYNPYACHAIYVEGFFGAPFVECMPTSRGIRIREREVSLVKAVRALVIVIIRTVAW